MKIIFFTILNLFFYQSISYSNETLFLERNKIKKKLEFKKFEKENLSYSNDFFSFEIIIDNKIVICNIHKFNKKIKPFCY